MRSRASKKKPRPLPSELAPLFWDYDFKQLSWHQDHDLAISRILAHGTWANICWLRQRLAKQSLRAWLAARRGAGLSDRQLRFWEIILDLPHRLVSSWMADDGRRAWEGRRHR